MKRFYNRADTVSHYAALSPQGILPVLRRSVVGGVCQGSKRGAEEGALATL